MAQPSKDVIEDITTRFILTAPSEQLEYFESLMFLVEQAWWYYEDNVRDTSGLRGYNLRDFAELVFKTCPELRKHVGSLEDIMAAFKEFKRNVPVMGAILLDVRMEHVLLVRGFKGASCWGFPRGKIMKDESDADCAVREVLEETGYDLEGALSEEDCIELVLEGKRNKLYIVAGLDPKSAQFAPKCKGVRGGCPATARGAVCGARWWAPCRTGARVRAYEHATPRPNTGRPQTSRRRVTVCAVTALPRRSGVTRGTASPTCRPPGRSPTSSTSPRTAPRSSSTWCGPS
ncbi:MAG: hypothetical protein J3K34DRAFT_410962 [Monoraphidium minutum]|nr:MAG: hypothetical protein J3K34DRAFT_410962 [Monoraphidium minutum]